MISSLNLLKAVVNNTEIFVVVHLLGAEIKRNLKGFLCNFGNQYMVGTFKCSVGALSSFVAVLNFIVCTLFTKIFLLSCVQILTTMISFVQGPQV